MHGGSSKRGRPPEGEGSGLNVTSGDGHGGSRTGSFERTCGALVPGMTKPGNAGGAKGPDFWHTFEDGKVRVIGDEPDNT
jgi:hypothetical protein